MAEKKKRKVPNLNASSMADISFLLLIFFLVTSSMDTDSGLSRRLPPPPQSEEQLQKMDVQRRNLMVVLVNYRDNVENATCFLLAMANARKIVFQPINTVRQD
jgi:biopolymer transport protein ExbD